MVILYILYNYEIYANIIISAEKVRERYKISY